MLDFGVYKSNVFNRVEPRIVFAVGSRGCDLFHRFDGLNQVSARESKRTGAAV